MAFKKKLKLIEIEKPKLEKVNSELAFKVFQYSHNGADFINTDISQSGDFLLFWLDEISLEKDFHLFIFSYFYKLSYAEKYLAWSKFKHKVSGVFEMIQEHFPEKVVNLETIWHFIQHKRFANAEITFIKNYSNNKYFRYELLARHQKVLHEIDLEISKKIFVFKNFMHKGIDTNPSIEEFHNSNTDYEEYDHYMDLLLEEAIASSKFEGAHTTRRVAKQLVERSRAPKDKSEQMIVNNYKVIAKIRDEYKDYDLSEELLLKMHSLMTYKTLDDKSFEGSFRNDSDKDTPLHIGHGDNDEEVSFIAPGMSFVKEQLKILINIANDKAANSNNFVHPVITAIFLHFWLAYLHPFEDGNGRMARALFYWYLWRKGYWYFTLIPISLVIKNSRNQYSEAFINSEQDENNLTYFIDYNLRKIQQAKEEFIKKVNNKIKRKKKDEETYVVDEKILNSNLRLNDRQISLMRFFMKRPNEKTNVSQHSRKFSVTKVTAANDLTYLRKQGFLTSYKDGRNVFYRPTEKVKTVFK
ncbi:MAG: Fic family protein [Candidatus Caenarcaniphilales bacterium]|nr:Fic family protein [Candidatus Caenarcaniphilales bacterium]